jgi:hypothetical protein
MTAIDRSIITVLASLLTLGTGYLVRAIWQQRVIARLRNNAGLPGKGDSAPALMYFTSDGCAPCRVQELQISELQNALAATGQTVRITSHDAVAETALVRELRVVTVPTTVVFAGDGRVAGWNPGLTDARTLLKQLGPLLDVSAPGSLPTPGDVKTLVIRPAPP